MNCPICQKAGISDDAEFCPQCNSDLSQLVLLTQLESKLKLSNKRNMFLHICASVAIISLIGGLIFVYLKHNESMISIQNRTNNIDSIEYYRDKYTIALQKVDSLQSVDMGEQYISYKVKNGDTLSEIALVFYNDVKMAKKIAEENRLNDINLLKVNQILKIEIMR